MSLFKRSPTVQPSDDDRAFTARLSVQFEETMAAYRRLLGVHAAGVGGDEIASDALGWARAGAQIVLFSDAAMQDPEEPLLSTLPEMLAEGCVMALAALRRLCYALTALAEAEVVEEALLRDDELDGLIEFYNLGGWLKFHHDWVQQAGSRGEPPPDLLVDPEAIEVPHIQGGMTPLRELLLTREVPDLDALGDEPGAPPKDLLPAGFYIEALNRATVILIVHHGALYLDLLDTVEGDGPSAQSDAAAIAAAVDVAAVQQSSWRRLDMIGAFRGSPLDQTASLTWLDDLCFSLLLLTTRDADRALMRLDAEIFKVWLHGQALLDWLDGAGYDRSLPVAGVAAIGEAREQGADDEELLGLTMRTIERAQVPAPER